MLARHPGRSARIVKIASGRSAREDEIIIWMRSLLMLRHAKSDWQTDYGADDRLRPLAGRGRRAATTIGRFLGAAGQVPDRAIASPAVRAQQTLQLAREAGKWTSEIETARGLYGGTEDVLDVIRDRGEDAKVLLIVGHEPTWSAAASILADGAHFRLPTASVLRLDFDTDDWTSVRGEARIQWLITPRLIAKTMQVKG